MAFANKMFQIDMVIHFAAVTHVDESYADRVGTINENVMSTTTLLESIANGSHRKVKRLVHISTGIFDACTFISLLRRSLRRLHP